MAFSGTPWLAVAEERNTMVCPLAWWIEARPREPSSSAPTEPHRRSRGLHNQLRIETTGWRYGCRAAVHDLFHERKGALQ
jgi:hypothetical protein